MFKQETSRDRNITYFRYVTSKRVVGSNAVNNLLILISYNKDHSLIFVKVEINEVWSSENVKLKDAYATDSDLLKTLEETFREIKYSHIDKCLTDSCYMKDSKEIWEYTNPMVNVFKKAIEEKYQNNK